MIYENLPTIKLKDIGFYTSWSGLTLGVGIVNLTLAATDYFQSNFTDGGNLTSGLLSSSMGIYFAFKGRREYKSLEERLRKLEEDENIVRIAPYPGK